jgi:hypothetical protein
MIVLIINLEKEYDGSVMVNLCLQSFMYVYTRKTTPIDEIKLLQ